MDHNVSIKSIEDFGQNAQFYIPSYQRGYRWKAKQVYQLIDDIRSFQPTENTPFYFLQALAVAKDVNNHQYNVVDGQQRLTTIKLILGENDNCINISYAREADKALDRHFKSEANKVINKQLGDENCDTRKAFCKKLKTCCRFLFYQVSKEKELDTFNELNSGKIAAKDSELVKCILLSINSDESPLVTQVRAVEWDTIERELNKQEFFAFLTPRNTWKENDRMTVLLRYAGIFPNKESDEVFPFLTEIQNELKTSSRESVWKKICTAYYRLIAWYNNPVLYHAFGVIVHIKGGDNIPSVVNGYNFIDDIISISSYKQDKDFNDYKKGGDRLYNYLLLSNVAFCWKRWPMRYSFLKHRNVEGWSLEHIFARNQKNLSEEELKEWIPSISKLQIKEYKDESDKDRGNICLSEHLKEEYPKEEDNSIKNLALLPKNANSSLNNKLFNGKRDKIRDWANESWKDYWAPPVTEAVFMKSLVNLNPNIPYWSEDDKESYLTAMANDIKSFIKAIKTIKDITL